jgi:DNA-binding beta-propeller fold protein YncE
MLAGVVPADHPAHALADVDRLVFAASRQIPQVAVIDTESDAVVTRIALPGVPRHLLVSPGLRKLIASDGMADRVDIVDLVTMTVERTVDLGFPPLLVQLDRSGNLLAIGGSAADHIELLRLSDGETRTVRGPPDLSAIVFDRSGRRLFATSRTSNSLFVVDLDAAAMVREISPDASHSAAPGIAFFATDPGSEYGFAAHGDSGLLSVFDLKKQQQVTSIVLPGPAGRVFPKADSQSVFVANDRDGSISRISTWTLRESARLPVGSDIVGINFGFFQTVAFALSRGESKVVAYDLDRATPTLLRSIELPGRPGSGTISPDGLKFYVALSDKNEVAVIDVRSGRVAKLIPDVEPEIGSVISANQDNYCH